MGIREIREAKNQLDAILKEWVLSESFEVSSPVYDSDGNIESADITWIDGDSGTISDVTTSSDGITSIRYNRSGGSYVTMDITYSDGNVDTQTLTVNIA